MSTCFIVSTNNKFQHIKTMQTESYIFSPLYTYIYILGTDVVLLK